MDIANIENNASFSLTNGAGELRMLLEQEINNKDDHEDETDRTVFELLRFRINI